MKFFFISHLWELCLNNKMLTFVEEFTKLGHNHWQSLEEQEQKPERLK